MQQSTKLYLRFLFYTTMLAFHFPLVAQTPHLDSLLRVLTTQKEDTSKANTLHEIARAYLFELDDINNVGKYGLQQLALSQKLNFKKGIAFGYLNRAIFYRSTGEFEQALVYDNKSLVLMKETGNKRGESSCYLNIGLTYSHQANYKEALIYMYKGIKIKEELGDKKGMAVGYNNMANIYMTQGNYTEALKYHLNALKIRETLKDSLGMGMSFNNMGNVFSSQGKPKEALNYYLKSLAIHEKLKDLLGLSSVSTNIGGVYSDNKQYKEALLSYFKAINAQEKIDDRQGIAKSFNNIGNVYLLQKNTEQALYYQLKSLRLYQKMGDKKGIAESFGGIGNIYAATGNTKEAEHYYNKMLVLVQEIDFKEGIRNAYENLASVYKKQKQFEKALEYTTLFNEIKDSILNKDNFKQVSELNTRYETDKKEKEILLLTKDQELNAKIIKQQQLVRWGLIGGLILLFISIFSIYRRYQFKQKANVLLETQKEEIQEKNMLITDSIDYAKTIQETVLPTSKEIKELFPQSFLLYKPKSIVSGDFYWMNKQDDNLLCAIADCTGHGVPGAFMSLLGYNMLENVSKKNETIEPARILNDLNTELIRSLSKEEAIDDMKHGMDISLIAINTTVHQLQFAGAHNAIYIVRNKTLTELKANKKGIGSIDKKNTCFTNQSFDLQKGDMIYLFTDGFPDQIGGPNRKKFYYPPFKELLLSISTLEPHLQHSRLEQAHSEWLGTKMDQTDDILIMGVRY
jgi:tetratricopeptide (TPR) repeat protein